MDRPQANVVVVLFVMDGCPACEEFFPRFKKLVEPYAKAGIPVAVYDAASEDQHVQDLADRWGVEATPTTIVARRGPGIIKEEGSVDDATLKGLLDAAYRVHVGAKP